VLFGQVVTTIRNLRKPKEKQEENLTVHQSECNTRFETGERMIAQHERDIRDLKDGQRVQCVALHALLEHALHNGNKEDMERASRGLFDHMNR